MAYDFMIRFNGKMLPTPIKSPKTEAFFFGYCGGCMYHAFGEEKHDTIGMDTYMSGPGTYTIHFS